MRFILAVVALLVLVGYQDVAGQKRTPVERIKDALSIADTINQPVPVGPRDDACKAFWKLSTYQVIQADFVRLNVKDPELKKVLEERVRSAREKAANLLHEKAKTGELGCGGRDLPDKIILDLVGPPPPLKAEKPLPAGMVRK